MNIFVFSFIAFVLVFIIFRRIVEPAYMLIFNRPVYVHFYPFPKKLTKQQKEILRQNFKFYRDLSTVRKRYFEHRVHSFIERYTFLGRGSLEVTDEMKLKIAATAVMLTFGMRSYLPTVFEGIIIYPDIFESGNGNMHKGEFNPAAKAIVFSWKHFMQGLEFDSDNVNLGLHEFAHAIHLDSRIKRRPGSSAIIYNDMFDEIMVYVDKAENRQRLKDINYFRSYAFTNSYEFIAVMLEYFFETPKEFKQKLPELYNKVKKMINFREG